MAPRRAQGSYRSGITGSNVANPAAARRNVRNATRQQTAESHAAVGGKGRVVPAYARNGVRVNGVYFSARQKRSVLLEACAQAGVEIEGKPTKEQLIQLIKDHDAQADMDEDEHEEPDQNDGGGVDEGGSDQDADEDERSSVASRFSPIPNLAYVRRPVTQHEIRAFSAWAGFSNPALRQILERTFRTRSTGRHYELVGRILDQHAFLEREDDGAPGGRPTPEDETEYAEESADEAPEEEEEEEEEEGEAEESDTRSEREGTVEEEPPIQEEESSSDESSTSSEEEA